MLRAKAIVQRRRRPRQGGYARGDQTRARIIAGALDIFGEQGFGGASTRILAERAGVTLPALQYYFDSKEGVYLACAEHISERLEVRFLPVTQKITTALARNDVSGADALAMLLGFIDGFADFFLGEHELATWALFIIREQARPTKAFDILYERVMKRIIANIAALVGKILNRPAGNLEVRARAIALIGQVVFFRTAREGALRALGWPDFDGPRLEVVKKTLRIQIVASLGEVKIAQGRRRA